MEKDAGGMEEGNNREELVEEVASGILGQWLLLVADSSVFLLFIFAKNNKEKRRWLRCA